MVKYHWFNKGKGGQEDQQEESICQGGRVEDVCELGRSLFRLRTLGDETRMRINNL